MAEIKRLTTEVFSDEELASWDRMSDAFKKSEKAKKHRDKMDNKYPVGHPKVVKAYADHKKAEEESAAAAAHAASFAKARQGLKEDTMTVEERFVVGDATRKNHGGIKPGDKVSHPEHGDGVVQHLDHVHDEVVFKTKDAIVGTHHSELKKVNESMNKTEIVQAILSKDSGRLAEAKGALKALLDARASSFRQDGARFVAKSLFETTQVDEAAAHPNFKKAVAIISKHSGGHKPSRNPDGNPGDKYGSFHKDHFQKVHKELTDAGFKHSQDEDMHTYKHEGAELHVMAHPSEEHDRYNDHAKPDHHEVAIDRK